MNCWKSEPEARPSFNDLTQQLKRMENQHKVRLSGKQLKKECFLFITQEKTALVALASSSIEIIPMHLKLVLHLSLDPPLRKLFKVLRILTWNNAKL